MTSFFRIPIEDEISVVLAEMEMEAFTKPQEKAREGKYLKNSRLEPLLLLVLRNTAPEIQI